VKVRIIRMNRRKGSLRGNINPLNVQLMSGIMSKETQSEIIIFKSKDGPEVSVKLVDETLWLTQTEIATLFQKDRTTINEHIQNIYAEKELTKKATCGDFPQVRLEGNRQVKRNMAHYNLDLILSVGYRVNSKRGTQFRIWANKILKDYLVQGYALNVKKLQLENQKYKELTKSIQLLSNIDKEQLSPDEATGLLDVIQDYALALDLLNQYDHQTLEISHTNKESVFDITYEVAMDAIGKLANQFKKEGESVALFGKEKDQSFQSSLSTIYQTFDGKELYPSIEEKAANLLYFVIKNHSFVDGNKRIAAFLFVWFLEKNHYLYKPNGEKRLKDNALVAICLMVAKSNPQEKDTIIKMVVNLINKIND